MRWAITGLCLLAFVGSAFADEQSQNHKRNQALRRLHDKNIQTLMQNEIDEKLMRREHEHQKCVDGMGPNDLEGLTDDEYHDYIERLCGY